MTGYQSKREMAREQMNKYGNRMSTYEAQMNNYGKRAMARDKLAQPEQEFGLTLERFTALEVEITTLQSDWLSALKEIERLKAAQPEQKTTLQEQLAEQLDKANAEWKKALQDWEKADADCGRTWTDWDKAVANQYKARANLEKADADVDKAKADRVKAKAERARLKALMEKNNMTKETAQPEQERNFCERCGKRTADLTTIHTCTPPQRKWVDLTEDEIEVAEEKALTKQWAIRMALAAVKERNA